MLRILETQPIFLSSAAFRETGGKAEGEGASPLPCKDRSKPARYFPQHLALAAARGYLPPSFLAGDAEELAGGGLQSERGAGAAPALARPPVRPPLRHLQVTRATGPAGEDAGVALASQCLARHRPAPPACELWNPLLPMRQDGGRRLTPGWLARPPARSPLLLVPPPIRPRTAAAREAPRHAARGGRPAIRRLRGSPSPPAQRCRPLAVSPRPTPGAPRTGARSEVHLPLRPRPGRERSPGRRATRLIAPPA